MREVERQVMLRIIDQRWREHLEEMDYLKEGINLRAMGQKDPLTEWQREGFEMFGSMMKGIAQDFVRYVMHVQVVRQDQQPAPASRCSGPAAGRRPAAPAAPAAQPAAAAMADAGRSGRGRSSRGRAGGAADRRCPPGGPDDPEPHDVVVRHRAGVRAPRGGCRRRCRRPPRSSPARPRREQPKPKQETVVKDEWAKTPRNAPCPCGIGKKFKLCHGQA